MAARLLAIGDPSADTWQATDSDELTLIGVARNLARDQEVFAEGTTADLVYRVISGAVRSIRLLADGRRQIIGFHLPGDLFGIEAHPVHAATAEAICETVLVSARRSSLTESEEQRGRLSRSALRDLHRAQDLMLSLGRRSALERMASFLIDLANRTGAKDRLALPMPRQDIADYLGLTIETVSRTLTDLQARGLVRLPSPRQVQLVRRAALMNLCE